MIRTLHPARRRRLRGQFNLPTLLALLVLLVLAVVALRFALSHAAQKKRQVTEPSAAAVTVAPSIAGPAASTPVAAPAAVAAEAASDARPRADAHGLSFGLMPAAAAADAPSDVAHIGCHGEPKLFGRPHQGSCNPYVGDTACNIVLPVLCVRPAGVPAPPGLAVDFYAGWVGGSLGASEPVMGALLDSPQAGTRWCERKLGPGWRMAEFHDGQGGWGLQGQRGPGLSSDTRYWVHVNDQPGNCWN